MRLLLLALLAGVSLGCGPVQAQPALLGTVHRCRVILNQLNADPHSEAFRRAITGGELRFCGSAGATALARVIRDHSFDLAREGLLDRIVLEASAVRDPEIFDAALGLALNPSALISVRLAGIRLAMAQHEVRYLMPRDFDAKELAGVLPCDYTVVSAFGYQSERPLPTNHEDVLAAAMQAIVENEAESRPIRNAAACVRFILEVAEGPPSDAEPGPYTP